MNKIKTRVPDCIRLYSTKSRGTHVPAPNKDNENNLQEQGNNTCIRFYSDMWQKAGGLSSLP